MRVAAYTLGCKVNQFETEIILEAFRERGLQVVSADQQADIYVVNSCAVTSKAAYQSRQAISRISSRTKGASIVATGCHVQTEPEKLLASVKKTALLVDNVNKDRIVDIALAWQTGQTGCFCSPIKELPVLKPFLIQKPHARTRAYIRVQDGCEAFCSYCIVPFARGRSRSLPLAYVREQVERFAAHGIKEVVITGIHVGFYGADLTPQTNLLALISFLCQAFPDIRFRLSSIEPNEVTDELLDFASATPNFCPHWHIPMQSGSDVILHLMKRRYSSGFYEHLLWKIHSYMPRACIGADVLVGFPGENETEFQKTLELLKRLPVSYIHAFPFSARPMTEAFSMKNQIDGNIRASRVRLLRDLSEEKRHAFIVQQLGDIVTCLVEKRILSDNKDKCLWYGHSENYIPIELSADYNAELSNKAVAVRLEDIKAGMAVGTFR